MNVMLPLASGIDWTNVLDTLIIAVPAIIAAVYAGRIHRKIETPSGKSIGKQVEDSLHTVIANYHFADAISKKVGADPSAKANGEARQVEGLTEPDGEPA